MLRNKQHSMTAPQAWNFTAGETDPRLEVLAEVVDGLDLASFLNDPAYRRRLNELLEHFSDEEFDDFERLYTRRFTIN
ncbi:MAG TPA: hypothetical protein VL974_06930 [Magnetospirillum sp.]|jgi:hypothetical protein|nr:hypothetical protein [Magnetospirillum sp.]